MTRGNKPLAVRLPPTLHEKVAARAAERGVTMSEWARTVIEIAVSNDATTAAVEAVTPKLAAVSKARPRTGHLSVVPTPCGHDAKPGQWCKICRRRV